MSRPPHDWLSALMVLLQREPEVVRVVIAEARGSVPREPGAFMLVGRDAVEGTIGGGRLEWESIVAARELLEDMSASARLSRVVLAADVGQCCGGVVSVWLERFTREDAGLLRWASEAGARGPAVLSSTIRGGRVDRRLVCASDAAGRLAPARAGADASDACATAPGGGGFGAEGATARGGGGFGAEGATAAAGSGLDVVGPAVAVGPAAAVAAAARELLGLPRQSARPRALHTTAGEVTFLERLDSDLPALWLYGAGHVGQALARILMELPLRLTWVDSRSELFPAVLPTEVRLRSDSDSLATVADAPAGAYFLVMTHSHPLDYDLVRAILRRNDFAWLGLIGSQSKAARFRSRLARDGVGADRIARLVCPIGIAGIESKWPAAIAVGVAAQVMQEISAAAGTQAHEGRRTGPAAGPRAQESERTGSAVGLRVQESERTGSAAGLRAQESERTGSAVGPRAQESGRTGSAVGPWAQESGRTGSAVGLRAQESEHPGTAVGVQGRTGEHAGSAGGLGRTPKVSAAREWEAGPSRAPGKKLVSAAVVGADCGQESCSTCGTHRHQTRTAAAVDAAARRPE